MSKNGGILKQILRRYSSEVRQRGRHIKSFSKKLGLIYFGSVDQHNDEHDAIRGLTVSMTHQDTHFAIGTYDGFDIALVDRFDVVKDKNGAAKENSWLILRLKLEDVTDIPHLFLQPQGHAPEAYAPFFIANRDLKPVNELLLGTHTPEFHGRYHLCTLSSRALEAEALFTPEITSTIAARFWPHAIEVLDSYLYVYVTEHRLDETVLGALVDSAIWLADSLEKSKD